MAHFPVPMHVDERILRVLEALHVTDHHDVDPELGQELRERRRVRPPLRRRAARVRQHDHAAGVVARAPRAPLRSSLVGKKRCSSSYGTSATRCMNST
jgi:hypothetical protein